MPIATPDLILTSFSNAGDANVIPLDPPGTVGAASFATGFPTANSLDPTAGGVPPARRDTNGILKIITANLAWLTGGGGYSWDADFVAENGGYGLGAVIKSGIDATKWFYNRSAGNTNDPDVSTAGWTAFSLIASPTGVQTVTPAAGTTNNFVIADGVGLVNFDTTAGDAVISGLVPQFEGQIIVARNAGPNLLTFPANAGGSSAPNRWQVPTDLAMVAGQSQSFKNFLAASPWPGGWVAL